MSEGAANETAETRDFLPVGRKVEPDELALDRFGLKGPILSLELVAEERRERESRGLRWSLSSWHNTANITLCI